MNLKILFIIGIYYTIFSLFFIFGDQYFNAGSGYTNTINLTNITTGVSSAEVQEGGLFSAGQSFLRFFGFVLFGIGLPSSTPTAFMAIFIAWQTLFTILTVGFIVSSVWDG